MAILRLPEGDKLPAVAPLADSSRLEPGMRVLAIGSPLGTDYQNTVTTGIIAGLNRQVKQQGFDLRTFEYRSLDVVDVPLVQTDAAINVGNSGEPLIDLKGEVVGLNTLVVRRDQNAVSRRADPASASVTGSYPSFAVDRRPAYDVASNPHTPSGKHTMTTRTIQMTLDSTLLDEVDVATRELDMTRSALIRSALAEYLLQVRLRRLERQDREAYDRCPATDADAEFWEALQDWGAP